MHIPRLFAVIHKFELASGQSLNVKKTSALLIGKAKKLQSLPLLSDDMCRRYGIDQADKGLGIITATPPQITKQWTEQHTDFRQACVTDMAHMRTSCISSRIHIAKAAKASKLLYQNSVQVPPNANTIIHCTQNALDEAVFGNQYANYPVVRQATCQPRCDGGLGHTHLATRLKAEWASLALAANTSHEPWTAMWRNNLHLTYKANIANFASSTCSFHLLRDNPKLTELQRRAYGSIDR